MSNKKKPTREQWILAKQMISAIMSLNAPFCDGGPAEDKTWLELISELIAKETSVFALEDAISVLERALELTKEKQISSNGVGDHIIDKTGDYCSCGQDACTCQACHKRVCGSIAQWRPLRLGNFGNVCQKCL